jgi:hypothetical protein
VAVAAASPQKAVAEADGLGGRVPGLADASVLLSEIQLMTGEKLSGETV